MAEIPKLYALLAAQAPYGVLLRRGPVGRVLGIGWNTSTDEFTVGDWLGGRVYVDVSGLSPDGKQMVLLVADNGDPETFGTQVSTAPSFVSTARWERAEGWHGGGWFDGDGELHVFAASASADHEAVLEPLGTRPPWTGPRPRPLIHSHEEENGITTQPFLWRETGDTWTLETRLSRADTDSGWRFDFAASGPFEADLTNADWAGLDQAERLVFARQGCLYAAEPSGPRLLFDANPLIWQP